MTKKNIFSFFFSMFFILMMANPALTNEDGVKGICMGGGEWFAVFDPQVVGNTSFSMRANFPGKPAEDKYMFHSQISPLLSSMLTLIFQ